MTGRQQWGVVAGIVALMAIGLGAASHFMKDQLYPVEVGSKAPDFRAKVLGADQYRTRLTDYKGQVVMLNVWATWCEPCRKELPSFQQLYQEYGPKGLKLVAVSIDAAVSEDSIRKFANHYGITFDVLHDTTHKIEEAYQTTGYPETFIIGPEGDIRRKVIGADDWTSQGNRALFAQLLGLQTPKPVAESGVR
jgi:cytochrome c biogenesis protein CcmG, thiol:disulfide interchange protein DsbE